jgi:hypothetical protein
MGAAAVTAVGPGDATFEEDLARIAAIMREVDAQLEGIRQGSNEDFTRWFNEVVQRVMARLGVELAKAAALIKDTMVILANGGSTFVKSFKDSYREHRQVERRRADGSS